MTDPTAPRSSPQLITLLTIGALAFSAVVIVGGLYLGNNEVVRHFFNHTIPAFFRDLGVYLAENQPLAIGVGVGIVLGFKTVYLAYRSIEYLARKKAKAEEVMP